MLNELLTALKEKDEPGIRSLVTGLIMDYWNVYIDKTLLPKAGKYDYKTLKLTNTHLIPHFNFMIENLGYTPTVKNGVKTYKRNDGTIKIESGSDSIIIRARKETNPLELERLILAYNMIKSLDELNLGIDDLRNKIIQEPSNNKLLISLVQNKNGEFMLVNYSIGDWTLKKE